MDILAVISIPFDPDIYRGAGFILSWHGFFTLVAVAVAVYLTWRWGRRDGLNGDAILSVATWCIIGGIIGARILHVVDYWERYQPNPIEIIYFWGGGIAIFGAYLGGFAGGATYITLRNKPWLHRLCDNAALRWTGMHRPFPEVPSVAHLADIAAPALLIALAIGRIGDVINGEHCADFSSLPWAVVYTDPDSLYHECQNHYGSAPTHPAVAYELIFCLIWAGVLWLLKDRLRPHGMLFALFFAGYSVGRFFLSFLRFEENFLQRTYPFGFNEAQWVALLIMLVTVPLLIYRARLLRRRQE